jgi:hypothetical protein
MCGSQELNGADSLQVEIIDRFDTFCDWCLQTAWSDRLQGMTVGGSFMLLCPRCLAYQQEQTALDGIDVAAKEAAREAA